MRRKECGLVVAVLFVKRFKQCVILAVAVSMPKRPPSQAQKDRRNKTQRETQREEGRNTPLIIRSLMSQDKGTRTRKSILSRPQGDRANTLQNAGNAVGKAGPRAHTLQNAARKAPPSPHQKHSDAWRHERRLLADASTRKNKTLKKLRQADATLLQIEARQAELLSAVALEDPAVDSLEYLYNDVLLL